ncbi:MAG: VOC family protein [Herpetosiphon sp.]
MEILELDHVQLAMPVGGEAAARHFYGTILGLREVSKPAPLNERGGCWFTGASVSIHLGVEQSFVPARKAHPALRVRDLEAARLHLLAAGVLVTPDDAVPHLRRFYIADPWGNRIECIEVDKGS